MATTREFFLTEGRDCLERLNAVLVASDDSFIEAAELHRVSRALRGSAQMARETRVQAVAHALEVTGRALVQGALAWGAELRGVLQQTIEDLAALVEASDDGARLDERAAGALERWERQGLELPALPDSAPEPVAAGAPGAPGPARPRTGNAGKTADAAAPDDLPIEVMNFFRTEAGALLDRIERMAGERLERAADQQGSARRELRDTVTALRDLASTFGFGHSAAAAERLLEAAEQERAAAGLMADVRRLITSEVPGQPSALRPAPDQMHREKTVTDSAVDPLQTPLPGPAGQPRAGAGVVPIEDLLYRGELALRRALELRPAIDRVVGNDPAAREAVEEVFDLIRLGLT